MSPLLCSLAVICVVISYVAIAPFKKWVPTNEIRTQNIAEIAGCILMLLAIILAYIAGRLA